MVGWCTQEYEEVLEGSDDSRAFVKASAETDVGRGSGSPGAVECQRPRDESAWRDRVKADLAAQVEAGGRIYGYRRDGEYVVRIKSGDRIVTPGHANS